MESPDGLLTISDAVRAIVLSGPLAVPTADELKRGNVAPATIQQGVPELATPTLAEPRTIDGDDVPLIVRGILGQTLFTSPR